MTLEERSLILSTLEKARAELATCYRLAEQNCALSLGINLAGAIEKLSVSIDEITGRDEQPPEIELARRKF